MDPLRLAARWVLPMDGAPVRDGAVLIGADGRIAAVGPDASVPRPPLAVGRHLGEAALLPGLVNAHAHLELMALRGLVRTRPFHRWVNDIRKLKEALAPEHFRAASRWGVMESYAAGITCIGDTGSTTEPARAMAELGARGTAYHEVFGPDPAQLERSLADLEPALEQLLPLGSERLRIGLSPHAPYTVSEQLLQAIAALARERGLPVAMHLAESPEEESFVSAGSGPFAEAHHKRGIPVTARGRSPVRWALEQGLAALRPLLIHCVGSGADDCGAIAAATASVAHCPWSNAVLGNGRADLALMRRHGIAVGLGTDSVAAGGAFDLFAEARQAALGCSLTGAEMLRLVTTDAARALGVAGAGVLAPGAWGDITAVRLSRTAFAALGEPEEAIAHGATAADVTGTWVAGRAVYDHGRWAGVDTAAALADLAPAVQAARVAAARLLSPAAPRALSL